MAALIRLVALVFALIRTDALMPREVEAGLSPGARWLARGLHLFSGRAARRGRPGERLAGVLERQGPAAIKFGQFLSTRGDMVGAQFALDLGRLKDRLAPFPADVAKRAIETALGQPLSTLFSTFTDTPVAAASLAQVHAATLLDGRAVAVKVLRPGIERRVAEDVALLTGLAGLAERFAPVARRLDPQAFAGIIARALRLELDLRFEAAGADELRDAMAADGLMSAPRVVWEGVARRVLTLEWVDALALSDSAALARTGVDRPALARRLIQAFLAQVLDHGVFHADLHEGNLFVGPGGELIAVDFGIIGRLDARERRFLAEILWGFLRRDYGRVAAVHFEAGYVPQTQDPAAFAQALRAVGEPVVGRAARDVSMSRLLTQLFEITALFEMRLRPELVLLQKTMATVEGVARGIDPEHDIWSASEPIVRRWITRELAPTARLRGLAAEVRAAAEGLSRLARPTDAVMPPPEKVKASSSAPPWLLLLCGAAVVALSFAAGAMMR